MLVKALSPGFHGCYRNEGDEFHVESGEKATWFVPVETEDKPKAKAATKKPDDLA